MKLLNITGVISTALLITPYANSADSIHRILDLDATEISEGEINKGDFPTSASGKIKKARKNISNQEGLARYTIVIDPFFMQHYDILARKNGFSLPEAELKRSLDAKEKLEQPGISMFIKEFEDKYRIRVVDSTSWLGSSITAYMNEETAQKASKEKYVFSIEEDEADSKIVLSAYDNQPGSGGELTTWPAFSVGINYTSSGNFPNFYLVDFPLILTNVPNEINTIPGHNYGSSSLVPNSFHSVFIASLVGAKANSSKIKGLNPGQNIAHYGLGWSSGCGPNDTWCDVDQNTITWSIENAAARAELYNEWPVLSTSTNYSGTNINENEYKHNSSTGLAFRKASNRMMVSQSAGNYNRDACLASYGYQGSARDFDGIVVVGGLDQNDNIMGPSPADNAVYTPDGSNFGACVDVWAPGHNITSIFEDGNLKKATGTSFAAPTAAAVASRLGSGARPIAREYYLRTFGQYVGSKDGYSMIKTLAPGLAAPSIPVVATIQSLSSSLNNTNINTLKDGKFYNASNYFNPGAFSHVVYLDLGVTTNIKGVRLTLRSNDPNYGPVHFAISAGNSNPTNPGPVLTYYTEPSQADLAPIYIPVSTNSRYIAISGNNPTSWLAYSEIEVYK